MKANTSTPSVRNLLVERLDALIVESGQGMDNAQ
jgi:hypothetical protein